MLFFPVNLLISSHYQPLQIQPKVIFLAYMSRYSSDNLDHGDFWFGQEIWEESCECKILFHKQSFGILQISSKVPPTKSEGQIRVEDSNFYMGKFH